MRVFRYFRIYRSTDPNFTPSPGTLAYSTASNQWVDPDYDNGSVTYKITATDFAGNESGAATFGAPTTVGRVVRRSYALYANVPNPFNPMTRIRYDVPEGGGNVLLGVYDVSGRLGVW